MDVKLVVHRGPTQAREFRLRAEETIIGRKEGCGLRIPSNQVSRLHCKILWRDDLLQVQDLKSANGTKINGQRVRGVQVLRPGDLLSVGPITFLVNYQLTQRAIDRLLQEADQPEAAASVAEIEEVEVLDQEDQEFVAPPEDGLAPLSHDLDANTLLDLARAEKRSKAEPAKTRLVAQEDDEDDPPTETPFRLSPEASLPPEPNSSKSGKKKKKNKAAEEGNPDASAI